MGLLELFLGVLIVGFSAINAGVPFAAWLRERDGRFAALGSGHLGLAVLGAIWVWGQLPVGPPSATSVSWPVLGLVLGVVVLWFLATIVRPSR